MAIGILAVVGIATDEVLELSWFSGPSSKVPLPPPQGASPFLVVTLQPAGVLPGGPICRQTFQTTVSANPGPNILNAHVGERNDSLWINGENVGALNMCFSTAKRVVLTLGFDRAERLAADPNAIPAVINKVRQLSLAVINKESGGTVATSSTVPDVPRSFPLHVVTDNTN